MKKRLFATLLACAMTVSLVACGGSSSSSEKKEDTSDSKKQEASTEEEVTDITKMSDDEIKEAMKKEPAFSCQEVHCLLLWDFMMVTSLMLM